MGENKIVFKNAIPLDIPLGKKAGGLLAHALQNSFSIRVKEGK